MPKLSELIQNAELPEPYNTRASEYISKMRAMHSIVFPSSKIYDECPYNTYLTTQLDEERHEHQIELLKSLITWCQEQHSRTPIRALFRWNNAEEVTEKLAALQTELEKLRDAKGKMNAEEEASLREMLRQALKQRKPVEDDGDGAAGTGGVRALVLGAAGKLLI